MDDLTRWLRRTLDALENIAVELERLRVLKEYELDVRLEDSGHGWRCTKKAACLKITKFAPKLQAVAIHEK